ncbi:DUF4174 domain-containing protein [Sungkyunkwania multivorans]|uniref:DUF4174 domain-containing protein n=1 Tax=Sungkyunkwania multivorans TaxID=1173618 RepID=A0ABW3CV76_9FLAO
MKTTLTFIGIVIFTNVFGQNLKEHQWKNRVLIIQAVSESSVRYKEQLKEFDGSEKALKERKIVLYEIVGDRIRFTDYQNEKPRRSWEVADTSNLKGFDSDDQFNIRLIGLDGGTKLKKTEPLKKNELFQLIDTMPMRMRELKNKQ